MSRAERFPRAPVSWGELIDKITILEIKVARLRAPEPLANAGQELALLRDVLAGLTDPPADLTALKSALAAVNVRLWEVEDAIREKEASQSFDADFIALARSVYHTNDERSRIKREINELLGSGIVEESRTPRIASDFHCQQRGSSAWLMSLPHRIPQQSPTICDVCAIA